MCVRACLLKTRKEMFLQTEPTEMYNREYNVRVYYQTENNSRLHF